MENSINNKNKDINETSVDHQLLCTICNEPFNDPQSLPCGHIFCLQCITQEIKGNYVSCPTCQQAVTINNFPKVNHTVRKNVNDLPMKYDEDKQTTIHSQNIHDPINKASSAINRLNLSSNITPHQNEQQNQYSAARLFEPFRDLLSDLINQNKQLKEEINQIKKQNQLQLNEQSRKIGDLQLEFNQLREQNQLQLTDQSRKNEDLQLELNQLRQQNQLQLNEQSKKNEELQLELEQFKKQSQLQHQTLTEQLKNVNYQYDLCVKRLNEELKKNEKLQFELDQLKEQSQRQLTEQSKKK